MNNDEALNPTERLLDYFTDVLATAIEHQTGCMLDQATLMTLAGGLPTAMEIAIVQEESEKFHSALDPELRNIAIRVLDKLMTVGEYPDFNAIARLVMRGGNAYLFHYPQDERHRAYLAAQAVLESSPALLMMRMLELLDTQHLRLLESSYN